MINRFLLSVRDETTISLIIHNMVVSPCRLQAQADKLIHPHSTMNTHSTQSHYTELKDKVVLITGATSGIGRVTAIAFARSGAKVVLSGRRQVEGDTVVREIQSEGGIASFLRTDVTDESQVAALVDYTIRTHGRLDVAFNNAGTEGELGPIPGFRTENYRQTFDINVLGTFLSLKHEVPAMVKGGGGSIINVGSIAGLIGLAGASVYSASKHAVLGITKSVALEVARQGIRVNAVSPAAIDTGMLDRFTGNNAQQKEAFGGMHPIGRYGQPQEIADAVLFLASSRSSFMTGQSLTVDGGFTAQ